MRYRRSSAVARFIRRHWDALFFLVVAPLAAIVSAMYLIWHTNWMTSDVLNVRTWPAVDPGGPGDFVLHGLLFCSIALVFLNTLAYGADAWKNREASVMVLYGVVLLIIFAWATEAYVGWAAKWLAAHQPAGAIDWSRHIHDLFGCAVFIVFSLMDLLLYIKVRGRHSTGTEGKVEEETFLLQLLMVDVPVVAGILCVNLFLHELLEKSPALGQSLGARGFLDGLGSGALLMQLALSQFVFLIIYGRYFKWEYRALAAKAATGSAK